MADKHSKGDPANNTTHLSCTYSVTASHQFEAFRILPRGPSLLQTRTLSTLTGVSKILLRNDVALCSHPCSILQNRDQFPVWCYTKALHKDTDRTMSSNYLHNGDRLARVVRELNGSSAEKVERGRRTLVLKSRVFMLWTLMILFLGAISTGFVALLGHSVVSAVLALAAGALAGLGYLRTGRYRAYATALVPIGNAEYEHLWGLAQQSDVVRVALTKAERYSRVLYQADLLYARALVVREARFGARPSDKMPLEQTKGMLGAVPGRT